LNRATAKKQNIKANSPDKTFLKEALSFMELQNYNCKKCGLTISSTCSKCDRKVDVKVLDDGCLVQLTKCGDCANVPVIKDVCSQQK